ncbi:MAG: hypothetical protein AAGJ28_00930 [Pseudomonadota bacterium]
MTGSIRCPGTVVRYVPLAAVLILSGCAQGIGPAVDWSLEGRVGQRTDADINRGLDPGSQAALLTNAVNAGLVLNAETLRALFTADFGIAARYHVGEDPELAGTGDIDPRLNVNASYRMKTTTFGANGSIVVQPVESSETIGDAGTTDGSATQISGSLGLSVTEVLDARNSITLGLNSSIVEFSDDADDLTPTRTIGASTSWERAVTETSTVTGRIGLRHFTSDNATGTRSQTLDLGVDLGHRRTPRHTVRLSAGVTAVRTIEEIAGTGPDLEVGFTGGFGLDYRLAAFNAGFDVTQSIEPSSVGALQAFSRLSARLAYDINDLESLGLTFTASRRAPISGSGDTLDSLTISPRYTWDLDAKTQMSLGYVFRVSRDSVEGTAIGHRIFVGLDHALGQPQ